MSTILITGGTGLIGRALTDHFLSKGHQIRILTRHKPPSTKQLIGVEYFTWNPLQLELDPQALAGADYVINLAGENVAEKRWSTKRKNAIRNSRINAGASLVKAFHEIPHQVRALVSASAIGWYGPDHGSVFTEEDPPHDAYLGETCRLWEKSLDPINEMGIRLVKLRIGIVLSARGGALSSFAGPLRFGIATILGTGKQMISWIHIEDLCRMFEWSITDDRMQGIYNAVAPQPETSQAFTLALARQLRGRFFIPVHVPAFLVRGILGEMSVEVLKSTTVSSAKIKKTGFQFIFPSVGAALGDLHPRRTSTLRTPTR